jgi:hypothetical protein
MMRARDRYDDESEIEIIPDGGAVRCRLDLIDADPVQRAIAASISATFNPATGHAPI